MPIKTVYVQVKDKLGGFQLVIITLIIFLLVYFSVSTRWIPPTRRINTTDALNQTIEVDGVYSYVYDQYIPKENNFEFVNSQIPKGSFEPSEAIFLVFLTIVLSILYAKKDKGREAISEEEAKEATRKYLNRLKINGEIHDYEITNKCKLRKKQVDSGEKLPDMWFIATEIITEENIYEYRMIGVNPFNSKIEGDEKTLKEFMRDDTCWKCGLYYDMKIITPTGYKEWYDTFEAPRKG